MMPVRRRHGASALEKSIPLRPGISESSFVLRPSSFVLRPSSFVLGPLLPYGTTTMSPGSSA
jgi:hypothetical protein